MASEDKITRVDNLKDTPVSSRQKIADELDSKFNPQKKGKHGWENQLKRK